MKQALKCAALPGQGPPRLAPFVPSLPAHGEVVGALATGTTTVNIGPCQLHLLNPELLVAASTDVTGHAELRLVVPNVNPLRGLLLHAQSFVLASSVPLFGLDASAGLHLALGD